MGLQSGDIHAYTFPDENGLGDWSLVAKKKVSERSERALMKTSIRATTKLTHSIYFAPSSLGEDGEQGQEGGGHDRLGEGETEQQRGRCG